MKILDQEKIGSDLKIKLGSEIEGCPPILDVAGIKTLYIDLESFYFLTSIGVRQWIQWLDQLRSINGRLNFNLVNVRFVLLQIQDYVSGFIPLTFTVNSIYAPYYCNRCQKDEYQLFSVGELTEIHSQVEDISRYIASKDCGTCGEKISLDGSPLSLAEKMIKHSPGKIQTNGS